MKIHSNKQQYLLACTFYKKHTMIVKFDALDLSTFLNIHNIT